MNFLEEFEYLPITLIFYLVIYYYVTEKLKEKIFSYHKKNKHYLVFKIISLRNQEINYFKIEVVFNFIFAYNYDGILDLLT